jgi:hypothetical protein
MKIRIITALVFGFSLIVPLLRTSSVDALTGSQFQAGNIISDGNFFNTKAMTGSDIQQFLNAKVPTCDTNGTVQRSYHYRSSDGRINNSADPTVTTSRAVYGQRYATWYNAHPYSGYITNESLAPFTCLKDYAQNTPAIAAESGICGNFTAKTGRSAAGIISDVATTCGINPMVLIVLLQKEQGLVTDEWPWDNQFDKATGFGCPDTSGCNTTYYGFFNQVYHAARQFQRYKADPNNWNWVAGQNNNIPYNPNAACGSKWVYIQNQATAGLYNYTPYQPNKAALDNLYGSGDSCSAYGNRNFWRYYSDWFGNPMAPAPYPFKTSSSAAVYLYADGYKFQVPSMALLQDYGYSPSSIRTISDASANAIPVPDSASGLSTKLSYVIKSPSDTDTDGTTVYLTSIGKRYRIANMTQFADFGFSTSDISYVPLNLIFSLGGNTSLSNYLQAPTKLVFQVASDVKRPILNMATFNSLDPSGSVSSVSDGVLSLLTSGKPLTTVPAVVKLSNQSAVYIYTPGEEYYTFPTYDAYSCWGAGSVSGLTLLRLPPEYVASPTSAGSLSCLVENTSNNIFLLNRSAKYNMPSSYGSFSPQVLNADLTSAVSHLPTTSSTLNRTIKGNTSAAVWYIENGFKRPVPSMSNYHLLSLSSATTTMLEPGAVNALTSGAPKLGTGQTVKTPGSAAVYVIVGDQRYGIASADDFNAYHYSWSNIETYDQTILDSAYPATGTNISNYLYRAQNDTVYLLNPVGCYSLASTILPAYGKDQSQIQGSQGYTASVMPYLSFSNCKTGSRYVKSPSGSTVYMMDSGQKRPVASWSALTAQAGTSNPVIIKLSQSFLNTFPTGPVVN